MKYEVIVVGGGHAGCEAAYASSYKGHKTALITININNIADMPCNPSIGGSAKGIIVREIDALGGIMGKIADKSHFQIKLLNNAKGPAVRSLRAQADKVTYPTNILTELKKQKNLDLIEGTVKELIVEDNKVKGIILEDDSKYFCNALILATGTYLKSNILIGDKKIESGPNNEKYSKYLSDNLKNLGFNILRLKTGTPPRIKESTINFDILKKEYGDSNFLTFSFDTVPSYKIDEQIECYLFYTNKKTHEIVRNNLDKSSMYGGHVEGVGARYCPSIEDKIVRFSDKDRHQLFLEKESLLTDEWYLQGLSSSMPESIQKEMVHSLKGLEQAEILKYGYAIEYDAIDPLQINHSLETKVINNLYTAGQINGTSGYEEAAAQGLIAGINASLKLEGKDPIVIKRNEGYIGVLIDDLVIKGTKEPYRMLTSRAEFRLILRHDNADLRLREIGYKAGLIDDNRYNKFLDKKNKIKQLKEEIKETKIKYKDIPTKTVYELLKRPEITFETLKEENYNPNFDEEILEQVLIDVKYEGYINKAYKEVDKLLKLEEKKIPKDIDYDKVKNLANEAREKLKNIRPNTIAEATRISGVNPVDISILTIYLRKEYGKDE